MRSVRVLLLVGATLAIAHADATWFPSPSSDRVPTRGVISTGSPHEATWQRGSGTLHKIGHTDATVFAYEGSADVQLLLDGQVYTLTAGLALRYPRLREQPNERRLAQWRIESDEDIAYVRVFWKRGAERGESWWVKAGTIDLDLDRDQRWDEVEPDVHRSLVALVAVMSDGAERPLLGMAWPH